MLSAGGSDTILDFAHGVDRIGLWAFGSGLTPGAGLTVAQFASGAGLRAATTAGQRVIYNTTSFDLLIDADGLGGAGAVRVAQIANGAALTWTDFLIQV